MVGPDDERRHRPPAGRRGTEDWEESWSFELALPDASLGAYVRLGLPGAGPAWYWAAVVGVDRPLVAVREHELPPPRMGLEVRGSGLWSDLVCETPLEHWTVGLEAFALAYDDPYEAWASERGERVALGFDLEWEVTGGLGPPPPPGPEGYSQPCTVSGEVLVGAERLSVEGVGHRTHRWGPRGWWAQPWSWVAGQLPDGTAFAGTTRAAPGGGSSVQVGDLELDLDVSPTAAAPFLVPAPAGRAGRLARHLCRFDVPDGRSGAGWSERLLALGEPGPSGDGAGAR